MSRLYSRPHYHIFGTYLLTHSHLCPLLSLFLSVHYGFFKFQKQKQVLHDSNNEEPFYWWRLIIPPIEYALSHAILFQMVLLPLTMCRWTIATLSSSTSSSFTPIASFIPFHRMLRMHIYLGYTMVSLVVLATLVSVGYLSALCSHGDDYACSKFSSEMMFTGYGLLAVLLLITGTSYFRHQIPYEVFYVTHHLVFLMYALSIAHTVDNYQRNHTKQRSQTFQWVSITLMYYVCDRVAMYMHQRYPVRVLSSSLCASQNQRTIVLRVQRPVLFRFRAGQYAYIKCDKIDGHWHAFSMASEPSAKHLEFLIQVFADNNNNNNNSWTDKLWTLLEQQQQQVVNASMQLQVEIMGPCGTGLGDLNKFSDVLALGTGTGIVPLLSILRHHANQLLRLAPSAHQQDSQERQQRIIEIEMAKQAHKGSFLSRVWSCIQPNPTYIRLERDHHQLSFERVRESIRSSIAQHHYMNQFQSDPRSNGRQLRTNKKTMKQAAFQATRDIYYRVLLCVMPVWGISLIGLTISWNTIPVDLFDGMLAGLQVATMLFHCCFLANALCIWDSNHFLAYTDLVTLCLAVIANYFCFEKYKDNNVLRPGEITLSCLLNGYMSLRAWQHVVSDGSGANHDIRVLEHLQLVWTTRSAALVSKVLSDLTEIYQKLIDSYGETVPKVFRLTIHVTDKDPKALQMLQQELSTTPFYNMVHYDQRPDWNQVIQNHSMERISQQASSHTLLAYVGSPLQEQQIHHSKISNDMIQSVTGNQSLHPMEFASESFGGSSSAANVNSSSQGALTNGDSQPSSWRHTKQDATSYYKSTLKRGATTQCCDPDA